MFATDAVLLLGVLVVLAAEAIGALARAPVPALAEMDGDVAASLTVAAAAKLARDGSGRPGLLIWCSLQPGWIIAEEAICLPRTDW
jgi:L-aminopeptidase/D-esterase-like protein